jgi:hypothetical protein
MRGARVAPDLLIVCDVPVIMARRIEISPYFVRAIPGPPPARFREKRDPSMHVRRPDPVHDLAEEGDVVPREFLE